MLVTTFKNAIIDTKSTEPLKTLPDLLQQVIFERRIEFCCGGGTFAREKQTIDLSIRIRRRRRELSFHVVDPPGQERRV